MAIERLMLEGMREPVSHYCHGVRAGDRLWVSGMVGCTPEGHIPDEVWKVWKLYYQYASFVHGLVRPKRGLIERISEWRLRSGNYALPLELKAFYLMDRMFGWRAHKEDQRQTWIMAQENESVAMVT